MELVTDLVDPAVITQIARGEILAAEQSDVTQQILPVENVNDIRAEFLVNSKTGRTHGSPLRSWDAESAIGGGAGGERRFTELVAAGWKVKFGEYNRLRLRNDPEALRQTTEGQREEIVSVLGNRIKGLRSEALLTGRLVINENKVVQTVDFGRRPDFTATAATPWSSESSDPIADLEAWVELFAEENHINPEVLVVGTAVASALLRHPGFSVYFAQGTMVTLSGITNLLQERGLPRLVVNRDRDALSPNHILLAAPGVGRLGSTLWGPTAEAQELSEYNLVGADQSGIALGVYQTRDPIIHWVHGAASYLPVLKNANMSFAAQVIA